LTFEDMEDPDTINHIGQLGSPTSVLHIFPPKHEVVSKRLDGNAQDIVIGLVNYLKEEHLIERISHE